jgi:FKBP-type peptidyl-prolyl cis-trans isomerase 2
MRSIAKGSRVRLRCIVTDSEGYSHDDGSRPIDFVVGEDAVIAPIETAVLGRRSGERIEFVCEPEAAYGLYRPELVFEAVREHLLDAAEIVPGTVLQTGGGQFSLRVVELTEAGAILDGNHPLAGKTLHFAVEVIAVDELKS